MLRTALQKESFKKCTFIKIASCFTGNDATERKVANFAAKLPDSINTDPVFREKTIFYLPRVL